MFGVSDSGKGREQELKCCWERVVGGDELADHRVRPRWSSPAPRKVDCPWARNASGPGRRHHGRGASSAQDAPQESR